MKALAIRAVGAAAVSLLDGIGTYLHIRFTRNRRNPGAR